MAAKKLNQSSVPTGFSKVQAESAIAFQSPSKWKDAGLLGRMVQGTLEGRLEKNQFGKCDFKFISTTETTTLDKDGNEKVLPIGSTIIVNETGSLNSKLANVAIGTEVAIDYEGAMKMTSGSFKGKDAHQFSVYIKN